MYVYEVELIGTCLEECLVQAEIIEPTGFRIDDLYVYERARVHNTDLMKDCWWTTLNTHTCLSKPDCHPQVPTTASPSCPIKTTVTKLTLIFHTGASPYRVQPLSSRSLASVQDLGEERGLHYKAHKYALANQEYCGFRKRSYSHLKVYPVWYHACWSGLFMNLQHWLPN